MSVSVHRTHATCRPFRVRLSRLQPGRVAHSLHSEPIVASAAVAEWQPCCLSARAVYNTMVRFAERNEEPHYTTAISYQDDVGTPISLFVSRTDDQELTGRWIRTIGSPWFVQFGKSPLSSATATGKTVGWYYHLFIAFWVTVSCYLAVLALLIVRLLRLYRRWESNHGVHDSLGPAASAS